MIQSNKLSYKYINGNGYSQTATRKCVLEKT